MGAIRELPGEIEWPRYESGELVGFGDEYVNAKGNVSTLRTIMIKDCRDRLGGGYYWKLGKGACAVVVKNGERIKRPPVLAADGEPLEVGQTVWDVYGYGPLVVTAVPSKGEQLVVLDDGGTNFYRYPEKLTHKRPDSWERIEEDIGKRFSDYWGCKLLTCDKCPAVVDGKKPYRRFGVDNCIIARNVDLVRRCKALAERGEQQ